MICVIGDAPSQVTQELLLLLLFIIYLFIYFLPSVSIPEGGLLLLLLLLRWRFMHPHFFGRTAPSVGHVYVQSTAVLYFIGVREQFLTGHPSLRTSDSIWPRQESNACLPAERLIKVRSFNHRDKGISVALNNSSDNKSAPQSERMSE